MNIDLEKRIADLEAREHIKELRAAYAWCAARGDSEGIAGCFTPDGVFEANIGGRRERFVGRPAILDMLKRSMSPNAVFPMVHNSIIVLNGDEATGTCCMEARTKAHVAELFPNGFVGYYHERLRRQPDGSWRFTERRWFTYDPEFENSGLPMRMEFE